MKITLTDKAYELIKMESPAANPPTTTIIGHGWSESKGMNYDDFDRLQTRYHGIPEHLIESRDHD